MKTIFIPLYKGYTARNFFYTDIFKILKQRHDLRLVVFCLPLKADYYRKKFGSERVIIEAVESVEEQGLKKRFKNLCFYSSPLRSTYIQIRRFFITERNIFKFVYRLFLNQILSRIKLYRMFLRWIDYKFFTTDCFKEYFDMYQPNLVYVPHFINAMDIELSKQAKRRGVFRIGMVNSWDNVSTRGLCRNLPDRMIAHNNIVKEHLVKYHDYNERNIYVSGIPQFDIYFQEQITPREKFFEKIGINPKKRLILFCPAGKRLFRTEWQVVKIIDQAIKENTLPNDLHILVRNNPVWDMYMGDLQESENITIEYTGKKFKGGDMNDWEFMEEDIQHLTDTLFYSELYVGCASTMVIDISMFNKPLIGIGFNGWEDQSFYEGVKWGFTTTHFRTIVATGGITVVNNSNELISWIKKYQNNPEINQEGRQRIITEQYSEKDGKAGLRVANYILKQLS